MERSRQQSIQLELVGKMVSKELSLKYSDLAAAPSDDLALHAPFCFHFAAFQCYSPQTALWLRDFDRRKSVDAAPKSSPSSSSKSYIYYSSSGDFSSPSSAPPSSSPSSRLARLISKKKKARGGKTKKTKWPWRLYDSTAISFKGKVSCRAFSCMSQEFPVPPIHLPRHIPEML
ncbi:hypothetical protein SELMODRAFT_419324 [Selaginella moellendorffii]|uniref:Uncharacterized protein n=1 Tax=Selaginella moellendorffii TaxID=88036 RepID=D8S8J7_SELML|nr:uncharacterized protein LOC9635181 [Selaginella moellendorffii]EFJ19056.1 hypothetical protein SELMODRAFT_419324 [Selaginella moellendorffii]|eukprot:XP_002979654.1 uncharacterized protein LOC9635181 [Selaginella moellendorffii]